MYLHVNSNFETTHCASRKVMHMVVFPAQLSRAEQYIATNITTLKVFHKFIRNVFEPIILLGMLF
jgi:hypothetical protein